MVRKSREAFWDVYNEIKRLTEHGTDEERVRWHPFKKNLDCIIRNEDIGLIEYTEYNTEVGDLVTVERADGDHLLVLIMSTVNSEYFHGVAVCTGTQCHFKYSDVMCVKEKFK